MIQDDTEKVLVDRAIDATSKEAFDSEVMSLKANPAYQGCSEDEIKKIALANCNSDFEMLQKQRKDIKPIDPTKNHQP